MNNDEIARLKALAAKWRGHWSVNNAPSSDKESTAMGCVFEDCADELDELLVELNAQIEVAPNRIAT